MTSNFKIFLVAVGVLAFIGGFAISSTPLVVMGAAMACIGAYGFVV